MAGKMLAKGALHTSVGGGSGAPDLYMIELNASGDTDGYFAASRMDYRDRQERERQKDVLKRQLAQAKMEKRCARQARDAVKKCDNVLEGLEGDMNGVRGNEVLERHRPTQVSADGATAAVEKAKGVVSDIKSGLLPSTEEGLKATIKRLKVAVGHARECCKQVSAKERSGAYGETSMSPERAPIRVPRTPPPTPPLTSS
jgi:hypothetical protein